MNEGIPSGIHKDTTKSAQLASRFLALAESFESPAQQVFEELESNLMEAGITLAEEIEVRNIFNRQSLVCRSESFSKVLDLVLTGDPLSIQQNDHEANMCSIASGSGFRTAMLEGFSGSDVGGKVKVVITFNPDHLSSREVIPHDAEIRKTKPETAQVSFSGSGKIQLTDLEMISFRFPIKYFPKRLLTENEQDDLDAGQIQFIVRHYIPHMEKTMQ